MEHDGGPTNADASKAKNDDESIESAGSGVEDEQEEQDGGPDEGNAKAAKSTEETKVNSEIPFSGGLGFVSDEEDDDVDNDDEDDDDNAVSLPPY